MKKCILIINCTVAMAGTAFAGSIRVYNNDSSLNTGYQLELSGSNSGYSNNVFWALPASPLFVTTGGGVYMGTNVCSGSTLPSVCQP